MLTTSITRSLALTTRKCCLSTTLRAFSTTPATEHATPLPYEKIPGPPDMQSAFQELLHYTKFGTRFVDGAHALHKKYGNIVRMELAEPQVYIFHPAAFRKVFNNEGKYPIGGADTIFPLKEWYQKTNNDSNVAFIRGERWKQLRSILQKNIFAPADAEKYLELMIPVIEEAVKNIAANGRDMANFLPRLTFDLISVVLFNKTLGNSPVEKQYIENSFAVFRLVDKMLYVPPQSPEYAELYKLLDEKFVAIHNIGFEKFREAKANFEKTKVATSYLEKLIAENAKNKEALSDDELKVNIAGFLFAGVDTTSNTMAWVLYNLARNQEAQKLLREEAKQVLNGRSLTKEDIPNMPYLRAVLKENSRVTPTVSGTTRILDSDVEIEGYLVPKGKRITILTAVPLMDETIFPSPETFEPARWLERKPKTSENSISANDAYLNMPFSRGPRMCLGARVAEVEIMAFITRVVQDYEFKFTPDSPAKIEAFSALTLKPDPSPLYEFKPIRS